MSAKNVARGRCRLKKPSEYSPSLSSKSSPQTKVIEYFPTVHRDSSKKFKRLNDKQIENSQILESPNKQPRLKSSLPSSSGKKSGDNNQKRLIAVTSSMSEKDEVASKVKTEDCVNSDKKYISSEVKEDKSSGVSVGKVHETVSGEEQKIIIETPKDNNDSLENMLVQRLEANKEDEKTSCTVSAVELVERIENSTGSSLSETLPFPPKYERLLRLFDYTEVVVSWLESQGKRVTLNEVLTNVQRKLKTNYDENQFAMILSVYPEAYKIRCERRWMPIGGRHCSTNEFEYVIESNLADDLVLPSQGSKKKIAASQNSPVKQMCSSPDKVSLISLTRNPMCSPSKSLTRAGLKSPTKSVIHAQRLIKSPPKSLTAGNHAKLEAHRLFRKLEFKNRLRKLVNIQHSNFVKSEGIEISPNEQLARYHPDFNLDDVTDIIPAKLPEIPKGDAGQPETMREYLKAVPDSCDTLPDKIKTVIKELRSPKKQDVVVADSSIPLSPKKYVEKKKQSTQLSLLERIRAKERERKRREMMRNPEIEEKKRRLERISRSLLQCICSYYNLKKVGSMKFVELVDKLAFSIGTISKVEIEAAVNLLCEVCSTYFKMVDVRNEKYVHLKENNFSAIRDLVNAEIEKCV
ncbi:unnamed protein product [Thelazia callipaeda]|uniref:CDT1 domain-containing protein n=1 Tax=Thelazia callipaeda TaxID=103827 RepID=A0A0N5D826_THECL|nr:unnamed protein product [Thelazia callipaeda]